MGFLLLIIKMTWADTTARFFDLIFAGGFVFLAICFIIGWGGIYNMNGLSRFTLVGYYLFFAVFLVGSFLNYEPLLKYCGFLRGFLTKSIFYGLLASFAFCDISAWPCILVGSI